MAPAVLFEGLSAFPPTPADVDGKISEEALSRLLERIRVARADSIGLLGSTGAYAFLSRGERRRAVEIAVECVGGRVPLIVGVGALRTDEAQALARDAKEAGADGLLLAPVSYTPLTEEEAYQHFVAVAGASDLPLCIYNNPGTTRFVFSEELIVRLSQVPNIAAVKMPLPADGDFGGEIARLRANTSAAFAIGTAAMGRRDALLSGADAWFSVVGGLLPVPASKLARAAKAGDRAEAHRIDMAFQPLWALFKEFGSFRVMYAIGSVLNLFQASPPRPILPLGPGDRARVDEAVQKLVDL
ncbi:dihydrodipicolinate synthase [Sinorhizobium meliloti CCBAU 01290]|nr:dihydrodipicolinate synthase [Sinorhizobium meliloti CCBAU 01290]